jgi:hypothetical protein
MPMTTACRRSTTGCSFNTTARPAWRGRLLKGEEEDGEVEDEDEDEQEEDQDEEDKEEEAGKKTARRRRKGT